MQKGNAVVNQDMNAANGTYSGFIGMVKFGAGITIAITALVVVLIS